jgi:hypothetical protein
MKVLANDGISNSGIKALEKGGFEVITTKVAQEQVANYINTHDVKVILVRSATKVRKDIIDACPGLKIIGRGGVGMDNIDVDYARSKGLHVINTPASSSESVAELVFAHLFSGVRFLHDANRNMPLEGDTNFDGLKKAYANGIELRGKTLGIVGFGRIGQAVAKMALGLGMKVIATDKFVTEAIIRVDFYDGQFINVNIVTESSFVNNELFLSEKIIKPIVSYQPFIVFGPYGYLEELKKYGFKTFSEFWDESYDTIKSPKQRIIALINLVRKLNELSIEEMNKLYQKTKDICIYNRNLFYSLEIDTLKEILNNIENEW